MNPDLLLLYVIGDSISIQYGPHLEKYLAGQLRYQRKNGEAEALLNLNNPVGANGGDSSMVLAYLEGLAKSVSFQPNILAINCGLHDIKWDKAASKIQVSIEDYRKNLQAIVAIANGKKWDLVWIKTTSVVDAIHNKPTSALCRFHKNSHEYGQVEREVMEQAKIPVLDLQTFTDKLGTPEEVFCDHVHYTEPVREKQACYIAGWMSAYHGLKLARPRI